MSEGERRARNKRVEKWRGVGDEQAGDESGGRVREGERGEWGVIWYIREREMGEGGERGVREHLVTQEMASHKVGIVRWVKISASNYKNKS